MSSRSAHSLIILLPQQLLRLFLLTLRGVRFGEVQGVKLSHYPGSSPSLGTGDLMIDWMIGKPTRIFFLLVFPFLSFIRDSLVEHLCSDSFFSRTRIVQQPSIYVRKRNQTKPVQAPYEHAWTGDIDDISSFHYTFPLQQQQLCCYLSAEYGRVSTATASYRSTYVQLKYQS